MDKIQIKTGYHLFLIKLKSFFFFLMKIGSMSETAVRSSCLLLVGRQIHATMAGGNSSINLKTLKIIHIILPCSHFWNVMDRL